MKRLRVLTEPHGWAIVPVHYSADPAKATAEWYEETRKSYPDDDVWAREFEIDFTSRQGMVCSPQFGVQHLVRGMRMESAQPIRLCMDFNFSPMIWEVAQLQSGWACFLDEIMQRGASVESMVTEFRNRYPAHQGGVIVYGDATGKGMDAHSGRSYYQLFQLAMRGYPSPIEFRVPASNPRHSQRVHAFNRKLLAADGTPGIRVDPDNCPEFVTDCQEVVWRQRTKRPNAPAGDVEILKKSDPADPYYYRTHAYDAATYFIWREFPIGKELVDVRAVGKKPMTADEMRLREKRTHVIAGQL